MTTLPSAKVVVVLDRCSAEAAVGFAGSFSPDCVGYRPFVGKQTEQQLYDTAKAKN